MTKIGENNLPPKMETKEAIQQQLEATAVKFENTLESYMVSDSSEEKVRLQALMDAQLGLIKQAVDELKQQGMHKQFGKVESDYKAFIGTRSDESYAALEHDIQTLRDYNQINGR